MQMILHRFDLPLRHVFRISRGQTRVQQTLIVELQHEGISGFGEAPVVSYYKADYANMTAALDEFRPLLADYNPCEDPQKLWQRANDTPAGQENQFALCALDMAACDLWSKLCGRHLWQLWNLDVRNRPVTNYTIGLDTIDTMVAKMLQFDGWPIYKIKLGADSPLEIITELRRHTDAVFRVDANCAWTADQCLSLAGPLAELGVEFIEQPLRPDDISGLKKLRGNCPLPIIADESCITAADVEKCAPLFDGINVKLCKCGGLTPARIMLSKARQLGLKTMCGCMTESSVAITAIAQLLGLLDYVDADGALLLEKDIASGVSIEKGVINYPDTPGAKLL